MRCGRGVVIGRDVQLEVLHGGELVLGDGCRIGDHTRIVVQGGRVEIGAGATLGERCTIVAHERVTVGARARLDDGAVLVDFDHVIDDVELPIRAQPLVSSPIVVGDGARIGLCAGVLRGVTVGAARDRRPARGRHARRRRGRDRRRRAGAACRRARWLTCRDGVA